MRLGVGGGSRAIRGGASIGRGGARAGVGVGPFHVSGGGGGGDDSVIGFFLQFLALVLCFFLAIFAGALLGPTYATNAQFRASIDKTGVRPWMAGIATGLAIVITMLCVNAAADDSLPASCYPDRTAFSCESDLRDQGTTRGLAVAFSISWGLGILGAVAAPAISAGVAKFAASRSTHGSTSFTQSGWAGRYTSEGRPVTAQPLPTARTVSSTQREGPVSSLARRCTELTDVVAGTVLNSVVLPEDHGKGRYADFLRVTLGLRNKTNIGIRMLCARLTITDLLDQELAALDLTIDDSIPPGAIEVSVSHEYELNPFNEGDARLAYLPFSSLAFDFTPTDVLLTDGTRIRNDHQPGF